MFSWKFSTGTVRKQPSTAIHFQNIFQKIPVEESFFWSNNRLAAQSSDYILKWLYLADVKHLLAWSEFLLESYFFQLVPKKHCMFLLPNLSHPRGSRSQSQVYDICFFCHPLTRLYASRHHHPPTNNSSTPSYKIRKLGFLPRRSTTTPLWHIQRGHPKTLYTQNPIPVVTPCCHFTPLE